jgi:hypothetical protein
MDYKSCPTCTRLSKYQMKIPYLNLMFYLDILKLFNYELLI